MKKLVLLTVAALTLAFSVPAQAEVGKKGQLGIGGVLGLGGATPYYEISRSLGAFASVVGVDDDNGAFVLSIMPEFQYYILNNLAISARLPFYELYAYEIYGESREIHAFPFMVGVKYLFSIPGKSRWRFPVGVDVGFSILVPDYELADNEVRFSLDFYGGFLYEVIDNLAVGAVFNVALPNIAPKEDWEVTVGRFSVMGTVAYFFDL